MDAVRLLIEPALMTRHSVQLVRVIGFDGRILRYMEAARPDVELRAEVGDAYQGIAASLPALRLCKIIVAEGRVILLEPTS